ncbi:cytochrome c-type biogenesis protein CcmH [Salmonella enterica subsp. enterica serovar Pullorum]|nr:cytochrome c-type biogenesis protein CcmH [Salmonella enterica subsp. enterica serovar Pullorum]
MVGLNYKDDRAKAVAWLKELGNPYALSLSDSDVMPFKDEAQEQQFRQLTEQLRCPKCQNNSIADSNAMIATDMRRRVYDLMQEGKSRQEIIDYMVARYGNFVTYDPPLTPLTVLLWVLPLAAIVAGGWIIVARTRRRVRLRRQLRPDRQLSAGQGLAAGNGADARAAGAGAGPGGAAAE